ncbi:MAG: 2'-5' RNA ligase family protein [Pseudonocardia sp.]|jgi:2'-5' RNA ligase|nr:2'-5' RNA ligase family protein [Pseudonocardia sp.]OJY52511.1 MAG: hypothetical protein BGP03_31780 [Pseudonocardia sp. 73-21]
MGPVEPELTAVVVPVAEAEPLVRDLRLELDASAARGVPAHVTVLFPFLPLAEIDLPALREVVAATPSFTATFCRVDWFGDDVVWLAPEPADPFVRLTLAVQERFGAVPYGGEHGREPVPHLTVGHDAPLPRLRAVAAHLETGLPFTAEIRAAQLLAGSRLPDSWRTVARLPLG